MPSTYVQVHNNCALCFTHLHGEAFSLCLFLCPFVKCFLCPIQAYLTQHDVTNTCEKGRVTFENGGLTHYEVIWKLEY